MKTITIRRQSPIDIDHNKLGEFCRKWKITEFGLFGLVSRDGFNSASDVDALLMYANDAHWSLFDLINIEDELTAMFHRKVVDITRPGTE